MEILRFEEAEPETLPTVEYVYSDGETELLELAPALWRRLEAYTCWRWSPRQCVWVVSGGGEWLPHLRPVSNIVVDRWEDVTHTWDAATIDPSPLGGVWLPTCGTYRITCTVGDTADPVPALVVEAYQRLVDYTEGAAVLPPGASQHSIKMGDGWDESTERSPAWLAKALQYSGAADLLRSYRRA